MSGLGAAVVLVLLVACSAPTKRPPQLPNARAELQLTGPEASSPRGTLVVRVESVDGEVAQGEAIVLPPGEHVLRVRIDWFDRHTKDLPLGHATVRGRLDDGHRYQMQAEWTPKDTVNVALVDAGDGHVVVTVETKLVEPRA